MGPLTRRFCPSNTCTVPFFEQFRCQSRAIGKRLLLFPPGSIIRYLNIGQMLEFLFRQRVNINSRKDLVIRLTRILNFRVPALAACLLFFLSGSAFVSHLGIQNDEALFANGIFKPYAVAYKYTWGSNGLPLMLMSYLGTLKSWIYRPIFQRFSIGVWAMRVPMLLAGAASVWLFYLLLRRVAGQRTALFGCGLLATDSLYLLTTCLDWGPVALQHLLLVSG